eukprot:scaffold66313_cov50-Attheya_sp.AAC.9
MPEGDSLALELEGVLDEAETAMKGHQVATSIKKINHGAAPLEVPQRAATKKEAGIRATCKKKKDAKTPPK